MIQSDKNFIVISSDNKEFTVDQSVINYSPKLKTLLFEQSNNDYCNVIHINVINSLTLSHIITFIKYNLNVKNCDKFNKNYINNLDFDSLIDIILGSKYLEINIIYELSTKRLLNTIRKTPEEIRKIFNIDNDL